MKRRTLLKLGAASALASTWRFGDRTVAQSTRPAYPPARAVTSPGRDAPHETPRHHFSGYYDKTPWDQTGRYLLAMEIGFCDRQPGPDDALTLGMVDLRNGQRYIPLDTTRAWCWQQGTMLQWLGSAPDREVIYNAVDGGRYVSVIRDVHTGTARQLPRPIYAVTQDGRYAVSLDFDRLHRLRPGYGYAALPERLADDPAPEEAGIYAMDLMTGEHRLIIPLAWAAQHRPDRRFENAHHWFNHLAFNPGGTRFIFLHRWKSPDTRSWHTRLYTASRDGSEIRLLSDVGMVSHFDWRDDRTILAWTSTQDRGPHFYLIDDESGRHEVVGDGVLPADGHCSYSPDRRWILCDTYPDRQGMQTLLLYRVADGRRIDIGRFFQPAPLRSKPYRCDLHPRWNRDGTQVCIDSSHEPTRQMYVIDVGDIVRSG